MGNLRNLCHHGTDRNAQACVKCAVEKRAEALLQRRGLDAVAVTESNCLYNLVGEDNFQQLDKRAWVILFDVAKDLVEAESREQAMRECLGKYGVHLQTCGQGSSIADSLAGVSWEASKHKWRDCNCGLASLLTQNGTTS